MKKIIVFIIIVLLVSINCARNLKEAEYGDKSLDKKVLIAGNRSEYKNEIIKRITDVLNKEGYYFSVIPLSDLDETDTSPFGAVLLINTYRMGKIDGDVQDYLSKDPANKKVIVFTTAGTEDLSVNLKVDTITSASKKENINIQADQIIKLIRKRFP
ncbi:MAG: hypothetical protein KKH98_15000 [Spirochaetes bacterium]|nr:hypothetical protein [Spirochaetota bacterium]